MALSLSSYPNPYSTNDATDAYGWIQFLAIDFTNGTGRVQVGINLDEASANAGLPPIDSFSVALGQSLIQADAVSTPPVEALVFPDLTAIITNAATFAASNPGTTPFDAIRAALYESLLSHPKLSGATLITD